MMNEPTPTPESGIIEISLGDIFAFFKRNWLVLLLAGLLFGGIGYGISYLVPIEYEASAQVLPEFSSGIGGVGGLSDLASMAGISLGKSGSDALRPDLYPSILSSKSFLIKILSTPFALQNGQKVKLATYLDKKSTNLTTQQLVQGDTLIILSIAQERAMKDASARITAGMDRMTGVLTIEVKMPDPVLAAACAGYCLDYLTNFVTQYRGGKKFEKVEFLRKQMSEAKSKYQSAEINLNAYRDRNRNTYSNMARVGEQRLQTEFMQAQTLYGQLAQQLEASRLQALEDAPVLKILEPPMVPNWKSTPKRSLYALGFAFLGGVITLAVLLIRRK